MRHKVIVMAALATMCGAAQADEFRLTSTQRISCSRGLSAGKLSTATCRSYAYLFNTRTSEYFRCSITLAMTRDAKEVVNVQNDGGCSKRERIFPTDSNYRFDVAETEPPNTNSFFGAGGVALWAADNNAQKMRGCISLPTGFGNDTIQRCVDMKFE